MLHKLVTKKLGLLLLAVFGLLTGCSSELVTLADPEASQEYTRDVVGKLEGDSRLGQSISTRRMPLNGINLWLRPTSEPDGSLTLRLFPGPEDEKPLLSTSISQSAINNGGPTYIQLDLPATGQAIQNKAQSYFIILEVNGTSVDVLGRREDAYPGGAMYKRVDGTLTPVNADLAFRLTYAYAATTILSDLLFAFTQAGLILPLGILLLLPGWLLLDLSGLRKRYDAGEQIAFSVGLSLAAIPLLLLWSSVFGLRWSMFGLVGIGVALILACLWRIGFNIKFFSQVGWPTLRSRPELIGLLLVFVLSLLVRFVMVRDLAAPAWVDSVHHATITRLILDQGQYPENYLPYLDVDAHQYHAGFHAGLAAFTALSGLDLAQAMLVYGQVLNALIVFVGYALTNFLTRDRRAGVIAGMVVGLLTPMPAYYTSWGRYTQLAGLLILPVVVVFFRQLVSAPQPPAQRIELPPIDADRRKGKPEHVAILAVFGLAAAGMFLIHYRVAAFTGLFLAALFVCDLRWDRTWNWGLIRRTVGWGLGAGGLVLLVTLPWTWATIARVFAPLIAAGGQSGEVFADFSWGYLTSALGKISLALAVLGLAWGLVRKQRWVAALAIWVGLLMLMANLGPLGVPGAAVFTNNTAVAIIFFIPIGVLGGYVISQAYEFGSHWLPDRWVRISQIGLTILLAWLALTGAAKLAPILRSSTLLFREADHAAMDWMRDNLPPDETVLVNPFAWGYNIYAGSDGGFWISGLTRHPTMPPPVLYGMGQRDEILRINAICQQVIAAGSDATALWDILQAEQIYYVYVGGRGGPISPAALHASSLFETLYQQDGTWVFHAIQNP